MECPLVYFTRLKDKTYWAYFNFYMEGIWLVLFFEDGIEKVTQAYNTKKIPAIGEFKLPSGGRGPNVIG